MENRVMEYEAPVFEFEEMKLVEDAIPTCWGYAYAWVDGNGDGDHNDEYEMVDLKELGLGATGCHGVAAKDALYKYFTTHFPEAGITADDCSTNVQATSRVGGSPS